MVEKRGTRVERRDEIERGNTRYGKREKRNGKGKTKDKT